MRAMLFDWATRVPVILAGLLTTAFCSWVTHALVRLRKSEHRTRNILHAEAMVLRAMAERTGVESRLLSTLDAVLVDSGDDHGSASDHHQT
jgi:hypothetical protein